MATQKELIEDVNRKVDKAHNRIDDVKDEVAQNSQLLALFDKDTIIDNHTDITLLKERVSLLKKAKEDHDEFATEMKESIQVLQTSQNFILDKICTLAETVKQIEDSKSHNNDESSEIAKALITFTNHIEKQTAKEQIQQQTRLWNKVKETVISAVLIAFLFFVINMAAKGWYDEIRDGKQEPVPTKTSVNGGP